VIQDNGHAWNVLRYIEANPLRARMLSNPSDYPWSSYPAHGDGAADPLLTPLPGWNDLGDNESARRAAWRRKVTTPQRGSDLQAIRDSLKGGRPYGDPTWIESQARRLNLPTPRPRGRPRLSG
jgi:putative transposase